MNRNHAQNHVKPFVEKLINQRFTVKSFKNQQVPEEMLEAILRAGLDAPSKQNRFPYRMYVLDNSTEKSRFLRERLYEYTSCDIDLAGNHTRFFQNEIKTAPVSVLITLKPVGEDWEGEDLHERAAVLRSTRDAMMPTIFMLLQAQEFDLGTSCTGCFAYGIKHLAQFRREFGIGEDEIPCIILSFGYVDETATVTDEEIPRGETIGEVWNSRHLSYVDPSNPLIGVTDRLNKGTTKKRHPDKFVTRF